MDEKSEIPVTSGSMSNRLFSLFNTIPLFFLAVYLIYPTSIIFTDGLDFAFFLERQDYGLEAYHPHHPLFLPLMRLTYGLLIHIIPNLSGLAFLQIVSAICGSLGVALFMRLLRRWGRSESASFLGGFFLGCSFTYWHYSTDASAYLPVFALSLWGMYLMFSQDRLSVRTAIFSGLVLSFAFLVHQIAIFPLLAAIYFFILNPDRRKYPLINTAIFAGVIIVPLCVAFAFGYLVFNRITETGSTEYLAYIFSHGQNPYYFAIMHENLSRIGYELARSHTHLFFHLKPLEIFYKDGTLDDTAGMVAFYRAFTSLCAISILPVVLNQERMTPGNRHLMRMHFFWLMAVFAFTIIFQPQQNYFRIFYLPPLIYIWIETASLIQAKLKFSIKPLVGTILVIYFAFNFVTGIFPEYPVHANPYYVDVYNLNQSTGDRDLIIFADSDRYRMKFYRYFGKCDALRVADYIAYKNYDLDIYPQLDELISETKQFFESRYDHILIPNREWNRTGEYILLGAYNFEGKHPHIMMISKEDYILVDKLSGADFIVLEILSD